MNEAIDLWMHFLSLSLLMIIESFQVGFEMIDAIAEREGISMGSVSFKALFGKGSLGLNCSLFCGLLTLHLQHVVYRNRITVIQ